MDGLLVVTYLAAILSTYYPICIVPAGLLMMWLIIGAHNYLHQADNWRMYYFNIGFHSFREWRVTHALSHHLFPNTQLDVEMDFFPTVYNWWPSTVGKSNLWTRYGSCAYGWIFYFVLFVLQFIMRTAIRLAVNGTLRHADNLPEMLPFTVPMVMYVFGDATAGLWCVIRIWLAIVCCSSFLFGWTAINAGHHHPEVFHDGDALRYVSFFLYF